MSLLKRKYSIEPARNEKLRITNVSLLENFKNKFEKSESTADNRVLTVFEKHSLRNTDVITLQYLTELIEKGSLTNL